MREDQDQLQLSFSWSVLFTC
uniref:Uncharacterized protein n=1 Tax=Arundo donax TaxID=35708 RepID=A0A0A9EIL4_ARUDO